MKIERHTLWVGEEGTLRNELFRIRNRWGMEHLLEYRTHIEAGFHYEQSLSKISDAKLIGKYW